VQEAGVTDAKLERRMEGYIFRDVRHQGEQKERETVNSRH